MLYASTSICARALWIATVFVVFCLAAPISHAQKDTVTTLHSFKAGITAHNGSQPDASLVLGSDGNYYGTTLVGGALDYGTVFKMTPTGSVTILHSFTYGADGAFPTAALVEDSNGSFYGTASSGGVLEQGTVFSITAAGRFTTVHQFGDGSVINDGDAPYGGLAQGANGNYYGTTEYGGSVGLGCVFEIATRGQVTILHSFFDGTVPNDGAYPLSSLVLGSDGNFYGTTYGGGSTGEYGTVYSITPNGAVTIVHSFEDGSVANDGSNPHSSLIEATSGNYCGTTAFGGVGYGAVFEITPKGIVTILHSFGDGSTANDGQFPFAGVIQGSDGNFYGTTPIGGAFGLGTAFQVTSGKSETVLHSFGNGAKSGQNPYAGLVQAVDGSFIGTTRAGGGGVHYDGTAFKMVIPASRDASLFAR